MLSLSSRRGAGRSSLGNIAGSSGTFGALALTEETQSRTGRDRLTTL